MVIPREHSAFDAPLEPRGQLRLVEAGEALEAFPPLWNELARRRPGMILRSSEWWEDRTISDPAGHRDGAGPKRFALVEQDGEPAGYAIYRHHFGYEGGSSTSKLVVVEAVAAEPDAMAAVWRFLLDVDWTAKITTSLLPPDHPLFVLLSQPRRMRYRMGDGLWVRLVDVRTALAARTYADDGELVLEVRDELCPWNAGGWCVAAGTVEPTDARADLSLDVSALGAAYLGGTSMSLLAQGRWVEERSRGRSSERMPSSATASTRGARRSSEPRTRWLDCPRPGRLAQLGEHQLDKLGVTGSSPVPPTSRKPRSRGVFVFSGVNGQWVVVAKWSRSS